VNTEYGWIKYVTNRAKDIKGLFYVYTTKLTDHPSITHSANTPEESLAACFTELAKKITEKKL